MSDMENSLDLWPPEAVETYAEAWVAANTQTILTSDPQLLKTKWENLPTMVSPEPTETGDDDEEVLPSSSSLGTTPSQPTATPALTPTAGHHSGKSLPIHCIVEQAPSTDERGSAAPPVEVDSFAIIPGATLVCDILRTVLLKLGYSTSDCIGAKGQVLIKNWKPLTFDTITDNPDCTAEEIFGDLTSLITLKIRLSRGEQEGVEWTEQTVRHAVLDLLQTTNQVVLARISPLSQPLISYIVHNKMVYLGAKKCQEFGEWYTKYTKENKEAEPCESGVSRFRFDNRELQQMKQWFISVRAPSAEQFRLFTDTLNRGRTAANSPAVSVDKVRNWWKNEKQKEKRIQQDPKS